MSKSVPIVTKVKIEISLFPDFKKCGLCRCTYNEGTFTLHPVLEGEAPFGCPGVR